MSAFIHFKWQVMLPKCFCAKEEKKDQIVFEFSQNYMVGGLKAFLQQLSIRRISFPF